MTETQKLREAFESRMTTSNEHNNAPAVPQCVLAQEVIDAIEAWKSAWLKVPPFSDRVNKATREAITISHNSLFLLLQSAQQAQRRPSGCPTPTGCGPHGCHGACIAAPAPAPAQEVASAFTTALDIRLAQGWNLTGNAIPVLYTDTINDYQVRRDDVWLCTTDALKTKHDVVTDDWSECKRISELPEVDEALRLFAEGETSEDQAVAIVQSVAQALRAKGGKHV